MLHEAISCVESGYRSLRGPTRALILPVSAGAQGRAGLSLSGAGVLWSVPRCAPRGPGQILRHGPERAGSLCHSSSGWCPRNTHRLGSGSSSRVCGMFPSNYQALSSDASPSLSAGKTSTSTFWWGRGSGQRGGSPGQGPSLTCHPLRGWPRPAKSATKVPFCGRPRAIRLRSAPLSPRTSAPTGLD